MKKIYSLLMTVMVAASSFAQDAGIFESYAVLNIRSEGNAYYDLQASTANPDFNGTNLGTYGDTESIIIAGGENKTYKNNGGDVTGGKILYRVYSGTASGNFSEIPFNWLEDLGNGDQKWGSTSGTTNILAGLNPGNYTLEVYTEASTNIGTKYSSNGGANYKATFTVVGTLSASDIVKSSQSSVIEGKLYTPKKGILNVAVYDFSGRLIKNINVKSDGTPIDLQLQKKGNYILNISDAKSKENVKFVY